MAAPDSNSDRDSHGAHVIWSEGFSSSAAGDETIPSRETVHEVCGLLLGQLARERGLGEFFELSLTLTDDAGIRALNHRHRSIDRATDVLSFPMLSEAEPGLPEETLTSQKTSNPADGERLELLEDVLGFGLPGAIAVGDVVISSETCRRQAAEVGHSVADEFWRLLVHGLLHLFGYDHEVSEDEAARMQAREDALLADLAKGGW